MSITTLDCAPRIIIAIQKAAPAIAASYSNNVEGGRLRITDPENNTLADVNIGEDLLEHSDQGVTGVTLNTGHIVSFAGFSPTVNLSFVLATLQLLQVVDEQRVPNILSLIGEDELYKNIRSTVYDVLIS